MRWSRILAARALCLAPAVLLLWPRASAATEDHFALLQIGTRTYTNVTVTTRSEDYVFIVHAGGMVNIKLAQIPPEVRLKLGYAPPAPADQPATNSVSRWAKQAMPDAGKKQLEAWQLAWRDHGTANVSRLLFAHTAVILVALGVCCLLYLFGCYCSMLICQKAGHPPGILVWLPILQIVPLLRAAGMSPLWLLGCLLPVLNLVPSVLWSINICKARGKNLWLALWLLLPLTAPFAFMFLAFSGSGAPPGQPTERKTRLMSLETA
jgi:hypothetical protein